jgi:hypothetical protein
VRALSDQNQAFVLRIKQLESYVVDQKDAMRALQGQFAALAAQHAQHAHQPPGAARGRGEPMRSSSGGGGGAAVAVSSFPVNLTPSSSPERAGGLLGVAPAGDSGDAGAGGGRGGQQQASSSVPSGGKFWSTRGGA